MDDGKGPCNVPGVSDTLDVEYLSSDRESIKFPLAVRATYNKFHI